jgi:phosphohistidine phosphatase
MNRLYLVRHGIAVPHGSPEYAEDERPLTPEGRKKMRRVARGLRRLGLEVDRIVTSPLPRARETAEIVAEALDATDLLEDADALRASNSAATIRDWLDSRPESALMIVGHNPSFSDLVGLLMAGHDGPPLVELRKGGVAAFSAQPGTPLMLDWLARPRLLSRLR